MAEEKLAQPEEIQDTSDGGRLNPPAGGEAMTPPRWRENRWKILGGILGILVFAGAVFGAYKLGQLTRPKERALKIDCQQDSDCVLVINKKGCCACPTAVNKSELEQNKDFEIYIPKETNEVRPECKEIICSPCIFLNKVVCETGKCEGFLDLMQEEAGYECVEESSLNCAEEEELSLQCTEEYVSWARKNCPGWQEKVYCKEPRPQVCTMECIQNPPYICGSNGKSYCNTCGACADPEVEWYIIQDTPCKP